MKQTPTYRFVKASERTPENGMILNLRYTGDEGVVRAMSGQYKQGNYFENHLGRYDVSEIEWLEEIPTSPAPSSTSVSAIDILKKHGIIKEGEGVQRIAGLTAAMEEYVKQVSGNEWVRVEDKKDLKQWDTVLCGNGDFIHTGYLYEGSFHWDIDQSTKDDDRTITHWQPLPKKPS